MRCSGLRADDDRRCSKGKLPEFVRLVCSRLRFLSTLDVEGPGEAVVICSTSELLATFFDHVLRGTALHDEFDRSGGEPI